LLKPFLKIKKLKKTNIAIFASGAGSNANKIIAYFKNHPKVNTRLLVSNKPNAGALRLAMDHGINTMTIDRHQFYEGESFINTLREAQIDFIVLAGFLWKVPDNLVQAYIGNIINIHPALLPKFGGKGMYGAKVHESVIIAGEPESGITIHFVDEAYDHGKVIFQATCPVLKGDNAAQLAEKVHALEYKHYPVVIENIILKKFSEQLADQS